ncbi:MAG TPA: tryptophan-rich sensory protein [Candidatus Peribacter riflensis]|uniref:Tryptophan-rich sensory protein n=1 Tax=Candidatus Peribacter riflensis TaxID=1735162 RepID=A0A0S1SJ34_9BACT|nr:MAG: tryptophan-rich sensory protein [Candidatus Peribacter riflensis]OGJ79270.1 MAG: TspO protein [Candidatus Peribacteria bacterium RIFOXYB1_FULL_57_12]ALM10944.1 MAG: TspO and MBR-like protein [Candidatus Peribacter riflensis]ALM12047.1 MAG: tryptophan-rich sensory protein [Candidatus Peribacter riflensis]ALM13150.1 MAG: tryptophan-rich sensory protein [Candidatus Peribacter riflensis]
MNPADTALWYAAQKKPFFAPPAWIFGPVWTVLYVIILISFSFVLWKVIKGHWSAWVIVPFGINLVANLAFSPIQFGLRNNLLAFLDILVVLGSLIWMLRTVAPLSAWVMWAQVPYLLWVSFATVLQASVTWLNR